MSRRELIRNRGLGFVPVIVALVAVQSVAALAFAAAGLRERTRVGRAVPA